MKDIETILYDTKRVDQFSSVTQSCLTLCDPVDCSMPGFPVHYQLPELAQTHVHQIGDAVEPSHPSSFIPFSSCLQSSPALGSFPMSQFFKSDGQSIGAWPLASAFPIIFRKLLGVTDVFIILIIFQTQVYSWNTLFILYKFYLTKANSYKEILDKRFMSTMNNCKQHLKQKELKKSLNYLCCAK